MSWLGPAVKGDDGVRMATRRRHVESVAGRRSAGILTGRRWCRRAHGGRNWSGWFGGTVLMERARLDISRLQV